VLTIVAYRVTVGSLTASLQTCETLIFANRLLIQCVIMFLKAQIFVVRKVSATSHRLLHFKRYPCLQSSVILDICDLGLHSALVEDLILLGVYAGLGPVVRNGTPTAEL